MPLPDFNLSEIYNSFLHCTLGGASSSVTWKEDSFDPVKSGLGPITQLEMPNLPVFAVDGLPHGTGFSLAVYAKNSKVKQSCDTRFECALS